VLDTETKGTGAEMVPLDKVLKKPGSTSGILIPAEPKPRPAKPAEPRQPSRFKVVDVMTRQTLAEGAGMRETLVLLGGVRSAVDVSLFVWRADRWEPLTLEERRKLWQAARR
jgi:hypothetical protein